MSASHVIKTVHFHVLLLADLMQQHRTDPLRYPQLVPALLDCVQLTPSLPASSEDGKRERMRLKKVGQSALTAMQALMDKAVPLPVVERVLRWLLPDWQLRAREAELWLHHPFHAGFYRDLELISSPHSDEAAALDELLSRLTARGSGWPPQLYFTPKLLPKEAVAWEVAVGDFELSFLAAVPLASLGPHLRSLHSLLPLVFIHSRTQPCRLLYASLLQQLLHAFPCRRVTPLVWLPLLFDPAMVPIVTEALTFHLSLHPLTSSTSSSSSSNVLDLILSSPSLPTHPSPSAKPRDGSLPNGAEQDGDGPSTKRRRMNPADVAPPAVPIDLSHAAADHSAGYVGRCRRLLRLCQWQRLPLP